MDILFITSTQHLALHSLVNGTLILGTQLLADGFSVDILRFAQVKNPDYEGFIREMTEKALEKRPKCVSFYTLWPYYHIMLRLARELKAADPDIITVFGGPQASLTAQATLDAMPQVDYICAGEGETTAVPFFRALLRREGSLADIPSLWYRQDGRIRFNDLPHPLCDLNTLPYWDERLLPRLSEPELTSRHYFMPIDAGRGCPYSCTFCCTSRFWRRSYRMKSPERIVADIRYYYDKYGIRSFWFTHDAFTTNEKLVEAVCDQILAQGLDIVWKCTTRIDRISQDLILKMKQAGLVSIEMGVESGSVRMQKLINKRLDLSKCGETVDFLLKNGLQVCLFFMYGFPEETEADLNDTLALQLGLLDRGMQDTSSGFCRFNPQTAMTQTHFDRLVFDPELRELSRGEFGFREELDTIRSHKAIFPFFFHLPTPVRNDYQFIRFLVLLYQNCPKTMGQLRQLYAGDHLLFYRELCRSNPAVFSQDADTIARTVNSHPEQLLLALAEYRGDPFMGFLQALAEYESDLYRLKNTRQDRLLRKTYGFNYLDLQRGLPIRDYTPGSTTLLLKKEAGKLSIRLVDLR